MDAIDNVRITLRLQIDFLIVVVVVVPVVPVETVR